MGFTRMEPNLALGKAHGFSLQLFVWGGANKRTLLQPYTFYVKFDDTVDEEACGTYEGRAYHGGPLLPCWIPLERGWRWVRWSWGLDKYRRKVWSLNALEPTVDYGTRACVCLRDPTKSWHNKPREA
jgi:hypothetical protein